MTFERATQRKSIKCEVLIRLYNTKIDKKLTITAKKIFENRKTANFFAINRKTAQKLGKNREP